MDSIVLSPFALGPIALSPSALTVDYPPAEDADPNVTARLTRTLADVTLSSTANVVAHVTASLTATLASVTLSSTADVETPVGETIRFAMPAADFDVSDAAFRAGAGGSNYLGAFIAIVGDGMADHAWYFTHDGYGWDPQPYNASLTGFTMHQIDLAAGDRTNAQVATAVRSAITGASLYTSVGGSSANVEVTGTIDAAACFTGSSSPGTAASWGDHNDTTSFDANPVTEALHAYSQFTAGPALITGMGARLNTAGDPVRLALYTGGTAASGGSGVVNPTPDWDDTVLLCETGQMTGSGTGWVWIPLTPGEVAVLNDNANVQHLLKGNTSSTHGSVRNTGDMGTSDLAAQQIALISTSDIAASAAVAYPASLEGFSLTGSFSVVLQTAFEYRQAPQRGDAGGITLTVL